MDTIPGTFIELIRETDPIHPSIRDIVARFAENRGNRKTRALIRPLGLAVRGALGAGDNAFLVGPQHLDFDDQARVLFVDPRDGKTRTLGVVTLNDGVTIHNAFFDRDFNGALP